MNNELKTLVDLEGRAIERARWLKRFQQTRPLLLLVFAVLNAIVLVAKASGSPWSTWGFLLNALSAFAIGYPCWVAGYIRGGPKL